MIVPSKEEIQHKFNVKRPSCIDNLKPSPHLDYDRRPIETTTMANGYGTKEQNFSVPHEEEDYYEIVAKEMKYPHYEI